MGKRADAEHDAALVALLRTIPEDRLHGILEQLGVSVPTDQPARRSDPRRCVECGHPYVVCRAIAGKTADEHEFRPDRSRSDR